MNPIGTEGLGMFETCTVAGLHGKCPNHPQYPTGQALRDSALAQSARGRHEQIAKVREWLWGPEAQVKRLLGKEATLTADDVWRGAEALGYFADPKADRRWLAHVTLHWSDVKHTGQYVPSTLPHRHHRPVPIYRWA